MPPFHLDYPMVPIVTGDMFPVRRIFCIGQNYADHAREMGSDPKTTPPFFFQKPADAVQPIPSGTVGTHTYPPMTEDYQHEVELVVALKGGGRDIPREDAASHIFGYAIGLDMTRRDRQRDLKSAGKPWELAKAFDDSAPIGPIVPVTRTGVIEAGPIGLSVNGESRQSADLRDMIWSIPEQIEILSRSSALRAGDLIFSGTPAGVGPVRRGDRIIARIAGLPDLTLDIV